MADNEIKEKVQDTVQGAIDKVEDVFEKADDVTAEIDPNDINNNKVFAILAYFGILVLIPIFAAKDSKFARFHANQGLILFIGEIICTILARIPVVKIFAGIIDLVLCVFAIIGIVRAAKGQAKELPIIGNFTILK